VLGGIARKRLRATNARALSRALPAASASCARTLRGVAAAKAKRAGRRRTSGGGTEGDDEND